jgi:hypothetical protein
VKLGAKIFGALAGVLILYLGIGFLLPGTWYAQVEKRLEASPEEVFPFLRSPEQWVRWNAMPETGSAFVGPLEGVGAGLDWDDPRYGSGSFRITRCEPFEFLEYEVLIESGSLTILGSVRLEADGEGSRMTWEESGDFGRNPLMGYAARGMGASQAEAMEAGLDSLTALLQEATRPPTLP